VVRMRKRRYDVQELECLRQCGMARHEAESVSAAVSAAVLQLLIQTQLQNAQLNSWWCCRDWCLLCWRRALAVGLKSLR
jgi:hypothetical protein